MSEYYTLNVAGAFVVRDYFVRLNCNMHFDTEKDAQDARTQIYQKAGTQKPCMIDTVDGYVTVELDLVYFTELLPPGKQEKNP